MMAVHDRWSALDGLSVITNGADTALRPLHAGHFLDDQLRHSLAMHLEKDVVGAAVSGLSCVDLEEPMLEMRSGCVLC